MDPDLDAQPRARPGYSTDDLRVGYLVDDLRAYTEAAEERIEELQAAIAAGRARLEEAHRRATAAADLRRRIAQWFLDAWGDGSAAPELADA